MDIKTGENTLAEFDVVESGIAELREKYAGRVYDVTTAEGMKDARAARAELRTGRTDLEKVRKALKQESLDRGRLIDSEAKRIKSAFVEIENPIAELINGEEEKKAAIKADAERKEQERIDTIRARIEKFAFSLSEFHPPVKIQAFINALGAVVIDDSFGELEKMAGIKKTEGLEAANAALLISVDREREADRIAEENRIKESELAVQRADLAEQREKDEALRKDRQRVIDEEDDAKREAERKERDRLAIEAQEANEKARQEELAAKLAGAKCDSLSQAIENIGQLCLADLADDEKVAQIEIIVKANS